MGQSIPTEKIPKYRALVTEDKISQKKTIEVIDDKGRRKDWKTGTTGLDHVSINDYIKLDIECKVGEPDRFKFMIFCQDITEKPAFRYDSSGSAHCNRYEDIPRHQQIVKTPHFNCYDDKGRYIAYRNEHLNNPERESALKDLMFAFHLFCTETRVKYHGDTIPDISLHKDGEIIFPTMDADILASVKFVNN